ncbi:MAG: ABC transporter permease [Christensenella sp.]|nr:ABC transporter permease [Christensenella sp.]
MKIKQFIKKNDEVLIVYLILIVVLVIGGFSSDRFFNPANMGNVVEQAVALGIVAMGQMLVILLGGIDLSTGAVVSVTTTILSYELVAYPYGIIVTIIIALAVGAAVGAFNGIGITKFKIPPFIMTLATMCIVNGVALNIRPIPGGSVPYEFMDLLNGRFGVITHAVILWAAIAIIIAVVLTKMRFGRAIYAVGGNPHTAELSGISVRKTTMKSHILCSMLAAVGGIYLSARVGTGDSTLGNMYSMDSITVCVLGGVSLFGGRGNIVGLFAATFILCLLSNILNMAGVSSYYQYVFKGLIMLVTVMIFSLKDLKGKEVGEMA